ncbi:YchJ family protein, partial [Vibrio parahaemolyticus]
NATMTECPCGSAVDYAGCCGRYHLGAEPPTAATLMRARYSAFALGLEDFLMATSHSTTRPGTPHLDPSLTWTRLQVTGQSGGGMLQGS